MIFFASDPKTRARGRKLYWRADEIDLDTGLREGILDMIAQPPEERRGSVQQAVSLPYKVIRALI
jgi:hypothetical protein